MKNILFVSVLLFFFHARAEVVNCTEAYGGKEARCEKITCDSKYSTFLGRWSGPFSTYVKELSTEKKNVNRSFNNVVTYSETDCLRNLENGETFIIGRRTDRYPAFRGLSAKETKGLLITGKKSDGSPFLRTVDDDGFNDYTLVYQNRPANMSVWTLTIPAKGDSPEMRFTVIDGQDFSETKVHKRNVTVTLSVGPAESPFWEGVVSSGFHSLK